MKIGETRNAEAQIDERAEPANRAVPTDPTFYKELLDHMSDGVYFVDNDRRILYWNQGAFRLTGYTSDEILGRCCQEDVLSMSTVRAQISVRTDARSRPASRTEACTKRTSISATSRAGACPSTSACSP